MTDAERTQDVQALLAEGLPVREVARRTGWSYGYVHKQAVRMGRAMTRGHPSSAEHPWRHAKISRRKEEKS